MALSIPSFAMLWRTSFRVLTVSESAAKWSFLSKTSIPQTALSHPIAISLTIPGILSDIWDSILRAVPKKKTSHMKKRHRQLAGKALKDVRNLTTCPSCGSTKRSHVLCPNCVGDIKKGWKDMKPE